MICFTGNHYLTLIRFKNELNNYRKGWTLIDDDQIKTFSNLHEVVSFIIETGAYPTVITYEKKQLEINATFEEIKKIYTVLTIDELLMLTAMAKSQDEMIEE